jgi:formylmethanofuran dehydrogenase subunit E
MTTERSICGVDYGHFLIRMEEFHGYRSPGILIGGIMLDVALREHTPTPYLNVVTETIVCLPDAVQLLTPCTIGNGFLQILDWGKFALTGYDRTTLSGVRVWLKNDKLSDYPLIRAWFVRTGQPREKPPFAELAAEILDAGDNLILHRTVTLRRPLKDSKPVPTGLCPRCGESYPLRYGPACPSCSGEAYCDYKERPS